MDRIPTLHKTKTQNQVLLQTGRKAAPLESFSFCEEELWVRRQA
jgi:hypothetical protein